MGNIISDTTYPSKKTLVVKSKTKSKSASASGEKPPPYNSINYDSDESIDSSTISSVCISRETGLDRESERQYREGFRKRVLATMPSGDISYIDKLIRLDSSEYMISAYDPYIMRMAKKESSYLEHKKLMGDIIGIANIKKYIKFAINGLNSKTDKYYIYSPMHSEFIGNTYPQYSTILDGWITILAVHTMYMNMWADGGELRTIFGKDCKPFQLRFLIVDNTHQDIKHTSAKHLFNFGNGKLTIGALKVNRKLSPQAIKCREDGLPDFNIIKHKLFDSRYIVNSRLIFYISAQSINNYINDRKKYIANVQHNEVKLGYGIINI